MSLSFPGPTLPMSSGGAFITYALALVMKDPPGLDIIISTGLGQYNSLGEYCGPHTASSVFLILIHTEGIMIPRTRRLPNFVDFTE